jgi:hypothetical protein
MLSSALSCVFSVFTRETTVKRVAPAQSVQMNWVLPWLVRWACCAGTKDFCSALAALVRPSIKYFYSHRTLFQFLCLHRPASWGGSRAGSPISSYVSLVFNKISEAKFIVPDWGDNSRLWQRVVVPARQPMSPGGTVQQPFARVTYIPRVRD